MPFLCTSTYRTGDPSLIRFFLLKMNKFCRHFQFSNSSGCSHKADQCKKSFQLIYNVFDFETRVEVVKNPVYSSR